MNWLNFFKLLPKLGKVAEGVQAKQWWASKTIWFNILLAVVTFGAQVAGIKELSWLGEVDIQNLAAALAAIGNIVLRFMTSQPLGKPDDKAVSGDDKVPTSK
jgi:hypothetical protein